MLTKNDLLELRKIIREEAEVEGETTRSELRSEIKLVRFRLEERLDTIDNKIKNIEILIKKIQ